MNRLITSLLVMTLATLMLFTGASADNDPDKPEAKLHSLLKAVQNNDYDGFVRDGTAQLKAAMTRQLLEGVHLQLAPRMNKGYKGEFLGELKQQGCRVLLWKIVYKDGGDDTLAKLVLKVWWKVFRRGEVWPIVTGLKCHDRLY